MWLQATALLLQMQLLLAEDATDAFEAAYAATAAALAAAQLPAPLSAQMRLHCAALHALYLLRRGRLNELGEQRASKLPGDASCCCLLTQHEAQHRQQATWLTSRAYRVPFGALS
jgi:hypothetical protein